MDLTDPRIVPHTLRNILWYMLRLAWFAAPWSLVAFATWLMLPRAPRHAVWALLTTIAFIVVLSPANVRAERFIFPLYFVVGALGFAAASRRFATIGGLAARTVDDWWLPAATWLVLFLASIASKAVR